VITIQFWNIVDIYDKMNHILKFKLKEVQKKHIQHSMAYKEAMSTESYKTPS